MPNRTERRAAMKLRSHKLPTKSAAQGKALMDAQAEATRRYNDWAADTVAAMNIGDPREGHQWLMDPRAGTVSEIPSKR